MPDSNSVMPDDEIAICNLALSRIGITRQISSFDDGSTEADQCKLIYAPIRNLLLAEHDWRFALKTITPTEVPAETETHPVWDVIYEYPADCLRPVRLTDGSTNGPGQQFGVFYSTVVPGTRRIGTIASGVYLEYIAALEDESLYPPGFIDALAWRLAAYLAPALAHNSDLIQNAFQSYQFALAQAKLADARSVSVTLPTSTRYKGAR